MSNFDITGNGSNGTENSAKVSRVVNSSGSSRIKRNLAANKAGRKPAATMWHRKKNEPIDSRLMPEKEVFQECILFVG